MAFGLNHWVGGQLRNLLNLPLKAVAWVQIPSGLQARNFGAAGVPARSEAHPWWVVGRVWAAYRCGDGVESGGGLMVKVVHEVPVAVDGDLDRRVVEPGLDRLWVFAFSDEPGGVRVTQVVDPARFRDGFCDGFPPDPPEGSASGEPAGLGSPNCGAGWGIGVEMMIDGESLPVLVDVGDLKTSEFSPSQTGVAGDGCERSVPVGEGRGELVDLGGVEEPHVGSTGFGKQESIGGRCEDASVPYCLVEGESDPSPAPL